MPAIQVRALRTAFYYGLRKTGAVFTLHDEAAIGSWMQPTDPEVAARLKDKLEALRKARGGGRRVAGPDVPPTSGVTRTPVGPPAATSPQGPADPQPGDAERAAAEKAAADAKAKADADAKANDL